MTAIHHLAIFLPANRVEFTLSRLKSIKVKRILFKRGYQRPYSSVTLRYGEERRVILRIGTEHAKEMGCVG